MSVRTQASGWPDDEPLPLPKHFPSGDDGEFAPDDDEDLQLGTSGTDTVGLDDDVGLDEPLDAELSLLGTDDACWTEDTEAAGEIEGAEDELPAASAEYGWTDDSEPSAGDELEADELGAELRESAEDAGDEGLGDDDDLGEAMELPPLRSGASSDGDEEGVDVPPFDDESLPDEGRVEVLDGVSWSALPEDQVRLERAPARPLEPPARRLNLADGRSLSITSDGLLCAGTEGDPAEQKLPEVGEALCLATDGVRRVAVLAREPSGEARLSLSLDRGRSFTRLPLPGTAFPRAVRMLGPTLLIVLPEDGAFAWQQDHFVQVLPGELHGACLVLEDDEVQLYAHLRTSRGRWLVRRNLDGHSRAPQVVVGLGELAPIELSAEHDAGRTRVQLQADAATWTVWIGGGGSTRP